MIQYPDIPVTRDASGNVSIEYFAEVQRRDSEAASVGGEIRMVANMPTDAARTVYLDGVAKERGREAAHRLRRQAWEHMRLQGQAHDQPQQETLFA